MARKSLREIIDEIKEVYTVEEYLNNRGHYLKPSNGGGYRNGPSPFGGDSDNSFTVYDDAPYRYINWNGHSVERSGDVIDLCQELECGGNFGQAISLLAKRAGIEMDEDLNTGEIDESRRKLRDWVPYWSQSLARNARLMGYLAERFGPDKAEEAVSIFGLGFSQNMDDGMGRITIPYPDFDGKPIYYASRANPYNDYTQNGAEKGPSKYKKAPTSKYGPQPCWGRPFYYRPGPLVVSEGFFDAMTFAKEGYAVISAGTGLFGAAMRDEFLSVARQAARNGRDVILIFDNDRAGQSFAVENAKTLYENKIPFKVATVPNPEGRDKVDVNECYVDSGYQGAALEGMLSEAVDGLEFLALSQETAEDFEGFMLKAARRIKPWTVAALFDSLLDMDPTPYPENWLKELKIACSKPPSDKLVCSEITRERRLAYCDGVGVYEFMGDVWRPITEKDVHSYIDAALGEFTRGARLNPIAKLLTARVGRRAEFNKKPLIAFRNGTLELETGRLRPHRPEDYLTVNVGYDYDPKAVCPKWTKFLEEAMDGVEEKERLLQEIAGYCLFPDNKLQRFAYLLGEGGNGKSVFLEVLEAALGPDNCSRVELSQFADQFYRVQLKDSVVNFSPETKNDIRGAEEAIKAYVCGEPITGCHKYEDPASFRPRGKLIVAANGFARMADKSFGMERRMNVVIFNKTYVDEPGRGQLQADPGLVEKLKGELPGVFNWIYRGYQRLKKNGKFTITAECREALSEFRELNDPVKAFVAEAALEDEFTATEAYKEFEEWRKEFGYKTLSWGAFRSRFRSEFLRAHPEWEGKRTERAVVYRKRRRGSDT